MRINIKAKNMEVSDYLRDMVNKKVGKLERYFSPATEAFVTLSIEKSRHIAEITVLKSGVVMRAEEATGDMYASVDGALKKIEGQIRKYRTKLERRFQDKTFATAAPIFEENDVEAEELAVMRTKYYTSKPMSLDEAIMQMEMLGHTFFVFVSAEEGSVNVLYRRYDGGLGLLIPEPQK